MDTDRPAPQFGKIAAKEKIAESAKN